MPSFSIMKGAEHGEVVESAVKASRTCIACGGMSSVTFDAGIASRSAYPKLNAAISIRRTSVKQPLGPWLHELYG